MPIRLIGIVGISKGSETKNAQYLSAGFGVASKSTTPVPI